MTSAAPRVPEIWLRLDMPNGDVITIANNYVGGERLSHYDDNHNVYRINTRGEVVWQVQRDDKGRWNGILERFRRGERREEPNEPFIDIELHYPDGTNNLDPKTGSPPDVATWSTNCVVRLFGRDGLKFVLDVDTGIAIDITPYPIRPW